MTPEIEDLTKQLYELKQKLNEARSNATPQPVGDYSFIGENGSVSIAELFGDRNDLFLVHNMGQSCNYCTLWADGFVAMLPHIERRAAFVLVSPDDPETRIAHAKSRGWTYSTVTDADKKFTKDMGFLDGDGDVYPGVSAFHKNEDGSIVRTGFDTFGPGDDYCSVWPLFGLLKDGPNGWEPE